MKIIMEDPVTGHRTSTYIDPLKIAPYRQEVPSTEGKFLLSNKNKQDQQDQHEQKSQQSQTSNGSNVVDDDGDDGDDANDDGSGSANATLTSNVDDNDYTIIWSQLSNENENYTDTATKNNNGNDNDVMTNKNGENGGFVNKYRRSISMTISSAHHRTLRNFWLMSILFGLNQACVNVCLSLATIQLGIVGSKQSAILFIFHTVISLFGATYVVKHYGSRNSMWIGMIMNALYVTSFAIITSTSTSSSSSSSSSSYIDSSSSSSASYVETISMTARTTSEPIESSSSTYSVLIAYIGATLGGLGAGLGWTAQGSYITQASLEHSQQVEQPLAASTTSLGAIFAYFLLIEELFVRLLGSVLRATNIIETSYGIAIIFAVLAWISVSPMGCLDNYITTVQEDKLQRRFGRQEQTTYEQFTASIQLFMNDVKLRYLIPISSLLGLSVAFINVYVHGKFVERALNDPYMIDTLELSAWSCLVAAVSSLFFGRVIRYVGKQFILRIGVVCFFMTVFPFLLAPNPKNGHWGWTWLIFIFFFLGLARATYEGTLRATYADFFPYEKEGAFASMTLIHGIANAIGYLLSTSIPCLGNGKFRIYCVTYHHHYKYYNDNDVIVDRNNFNTIDEMVNDDVFLSNEGSSSSSRSILLFELIFIIITILSIRGYTKAIALYNEQIAINRLALSDGNDMT